MERCTRLWMTTGRSATWSFEYIAGTSYFLLQRKGTWSSIQLSPSYINLFTSIHHSSIYASNIPKTSSHTPNPAPASSRS
jgi:hypothetical protein